EAFTRMRARGAKITDIVVIVVAADDGVMPQTLEAIDHARAANVPIIVAVNKIDKPDANPDRVKQQLADRGLQPDDWGGDTPFVNVSAKQRINLDGLEEMICLQADLRPQKATPERPAVGTVIEAKLDRGRGAVASILVQNGTLKPWTATSSATPSARSAPCSTTVASRSPRPVPRPPSRSSASRACPTPATPSSSWPIATAPRRSPATAP